jgi:hypothetical protein
LNEAHPHKDIDYFYHRYFSHPVRRYMVYAVKEKGIQTISAFLIFREVEKSGTKVLRIIDYIGAEKYLGLLSSPMQKLMDKGDYEYIDCYCIGMSEKTMNNAGFVLRTANDANIIPN